MQGTIAQAIALTTHANAFLRGRPAVYWPGNSTAAFCKSITFLVLERSRKQFGAKPEERQIAPDPQTWFQWLRDQGCESVLLRQSPSGRGDDHMTVGFVGGGGQWALEAGTGKTTDAWMARWQVIEPRPADNKVWRVDYGRLGTFLRSEDSPPDLSGDIIANLRDALTSIHAFAERIDAQAFAACFAKALRALEGADEPAAYHRDLAPPDTLPTFAMAILTACQHAWVFGGMGSWNDMGFNDTLLQPEYERVSGQLFTLLNQALVAAANYSATDSWR